MGEMVKAGTVLFKEGTLLPDSLTFESEPYSPGWRSVTGLDGYAMDRKIHDAGWTFFCLAYEAKATVFGIDTEKMVRRAIERILANRKAEAEKFNSLEIVRVASLDSKRYLGVRHVTVCARSRHIQESPIIFHTQNRGFEVASPRKIELRRDQRVGLSPGKELPLNEIKTPSPESIRM